MMLEEIFNRLAFPWKSLTIVWYISRSLWKIGKRDGFDFVMDVNGRHAYRLRWAVVRDCASAAKENENGQKDVRHSFVLTLGISTIP
jgi:hypothetical protein